MRAFSVITLLFCSLVVTGEASARIIDSDQHWRLSDSPITVSETLSIESDATLTIDPGVEVRFESNTSLNVVQGALDAHGLPGQPIIFTSASADSSRQPGDWGGIYIGPSANHAATQIRHAELSFSVGLRLEGASPTIDHVLFDSNSGPAIDMDLRSSPSGWGLRAYNNQLNGIRVPQGTISEDVVWALRGIPYVLASGTIRVGRPAFSILPQDVQLATGASVDMTLLIPATAEGQALDVDLVSSVPGVISALDVISIPPGADRATFTVTAENAGTTSLSASHPLYGLAEASVEVVRQPGILLEPNSTRLGLGYKQDIEVSLEAAAPPGGVVVNIETTPSGVISHPQSIAFAEGERSQTFSVEGNSQGSAQLSLTASGYRAGVAQVDVVPPSFALPETLFLAPGNSREIALTLSHPAPAGGLTVLLTTDNDQVLGIPAEVHIAEGEASASISVSALVAGSAQLRASATQWLSAETTVNVQTIELDLAPALADFLPVGQQHSYELILSAPAPAGGLMIDVEVDQPSLLETSATTFSVPEGQIRASQSLTMQGLAEGEAVMALTIRGGDPLALPVTVTPSVEIEGSIETFVIGKGVLSYQTGLALTLTSGTDNYVPQAPLVIELACSDSLICDVHETAQFSAGQTRAYVQFYGKSLGVSELVVSSGDFSFASPVSISVVETELAFDDLALNRGLGEQRDRTRLQWHVPGGTSLNEWFSTSRDDVSVQLQLSGESPTGVVDGIWDASAGGSQIASVAIPAGARRSGYFYVGSPTSAGSYRVQASVPELTQLESSTVQVSGGELSFSRASVVLGSGLNSYISTVYLQRRTNGDPLRGNDPLVVSLDCLDDAVCEVPTQVTIPAGEYQVGLTILGGSVGSTQISAQSAGFDPAERLDVDIVEPELQFEYLKTQRGVGEARNRVRLRWHVPGGTSPSNVLSSLPVGGDVDVSLVETNPTGILDGIWDSSTQGARISSVFMPAGAYRSGYFYLGTPLQSGSYQVQGALAGTVSSRSDTVTVVGGEIAFSRASVAIGKGLESYLYTLRVERRVNGTPFSGSEPLTVSLACTDESICLAPASVTIPAGQSSVGVAIQGVDLGDTALTATAADYGQPASVDVQVLESQLVFESMAETRAIGEARYRSRLEWYVPNATGSNRTLSRLPSEQMINIAIVDSTAPDLIDGLWNSSDAGQTIDQIRMPADQSTSEYFYVGEPIAEGAYRIEARAAEFPPARSSVVSVVIPSLRFSREALIVGAGLKSPSWAMRLERWAGDRRSPLAVDQAFNVRCGSAAVCAPAESVTMPAGAYSVSLSFTGGILGVTSIEASGSGYSSAPPATAETVQPVLAFSGLAQTIQVANSDRFDLDLLVPGSSWPQHHVTESELSLQLSSDFPGVLSLDQTTVRVPIGRTSSDYVTANGLSPGTAEITVSGAGFEPVTSEPVEVIE